MVSYVNNAFEIIVDKFIPPCCNVTPFIVPIAPIFPTLSNITVCVEPE